MIYLLNAFPDLFAFMSKWAASFGEGTKGSNAVMIAAIAICVVAGYLLGSLNSAIIVSKSKYRQDIRSFGSGNAGLTNMYRVYGKGAAGLTLLGDILKQVVSVFLGVLLIGVNGAYIAGFCCMLGHIFPVYYRFKGGKGVLTAATMILLIDPIVFAILFVVFALVLIFTQYVSLASVLAAFSYPAVVYYMSGRNPSVFAMIFAIFVGAIIIFKHRSNLFRIFNNEENKFSFKNKPQIQSVLDKEDPENDKKNEYIPEIRKKKKKKKK